MVLKGIAASAENADVVLEYVHTQQLLLLPDDLLQHAGVVLLKNS